MSRLQRIMLAAVAMASLAVAPGPAFAQMTGSRIGSNATKKDLGKLTEMFAECAVKRRPATVRTWLNELPGTVAEFQYVRSQEGDLGMCVGDDKLVVGNRVFVFEPGALRPPLALAYARWLLHDNANAPIGLSPDSPAWFMATYTALPDGSHVDTRTLALQDFGHCVATSNWQGSRALILAKAKSKDEAAAVQALIPSLGPCIDQNAKFELTPNVLRVALAEPMVHIQEAAE